LWPTGKTNTFFFKDHNEKLTHEIGVSKAILTPASPFIMIDKHRLMNLTYTSVTLYEQKWLILADHHSQHLHEISHPDFGFGDILTSTLKLLRLFLETFKLGSSFNLPSSASKIKHNKGVEVHQNFNLIRSSDQYILRASNL